MDDSVVNEAAEAIKEEGNSFFKAGDFVTALQLYSKAIELDPSSSKYLINRSLCYASVKDWANSAEDARASLKLAPKAQKAHFRLVKALFELDRFKDARLAILNGLKECGESKEMKSLEDELAVRTGIPLRPKSTDFEIVGELGDGNFSKVYKALHKSTQKVFAIKTIEKMTVDRMKKRHGNINNEILMEKRALHRLNYPGIVTLYNTFQDYGTLYYQMEYVGGNDLWHRLHEVQLTGHLTATGSNAEASAGDNAQHAQVGCHWSMARFYMAQAINAVEHMHQHGIAHRDIKPENMIITENGHLKFVDFGTAKDFIHTDLNGPEFVGTPEYLSPSTVRNKKCGVEVDLWALGIVLHQMLLGYTPYGAPSPYLTFLRIKRSFLQIPDWIPAPLASMMRLLLQSDAKARLRSACGLDATSDSSADTSALGTTKHPSGINYDALRGHEMFTNAHATYPGVCAAHASTFDDLSTVESVRSVYEREAHKVPTLRELSLRATGRAALLLAAATAENGGVRPKSPAWMQTFNLAKLCALDRAQIKHYLSRQQRLHTPGVYRLFCSSVVETRSKRSEPSTGEYIGLTRGLHGHWDKDFHFVQLASPLFGAPAAGGDAVSDGLTEPAEETRLKTLIASVNKLRPKFLVIIGNLTHASPSDGSLFDTQVESVRKTMARLSDTIPAIYVPGSHDVGAVPTVATLHAYRERFGADYFGFWFGGMRGVVINSSLMISPQGAPDEAARQDMWLTEEVEQCKLCSNCIVVFSYHPWFVSDIDEPDVEITHGTTSVFPKALRQKWLKKLRHHKVMLAISSSTGNVCLDPTDTEAEVVTAKALRPFPRKKGSKSKKMEEEEQEMGAELAKQALNVITRPDGEPMRPSEIIAAALSAGELTSQDVTPEAPDGPETEKEAETGDSNGLPIVPSLTDAEMPPAAPESDAALPGLAKESEEGENDGNSSDSDKESDYEPDESAEKNDAEEEEFANEEEDFEGPELLPTPVGTAGSAAGATGLRAVLVREHDMRHAFFPSATVPATMADLLAHLN